MLRVKDTGSFARSRRTAKDLTSTARWCVTRSTAQSTSFARSCRCGEQRQHVRVRSQVLVRHPQRRPVHVLCPQLTRHSASDNVSKCL